MDTNSQKQKQPIIIQQVMHSSDDFEANEQFEDEYNGVTTKRIKLENHSNYDEIIYEDSSSSIANPYFTTPTPATIESVSRDVHNLNKRVKRLEDTVRTNHKIINNKLNIILDYLLKNASSEPEYNHQLQQQPPAFSCPDDDTTTDTTFVPKPVDSRETFDDIETRLRNFDCDPMQHREFGPIRRQMVKYYSRRLSNINNRTDPKNGLMHSLMCLYFEKEFLATIGWTAVGIRWPIKDAKGHFSLFRDIVNANSVHTYANNDEASHAVFTFLRRYHEKKSKEAKILMSEMVGSGVVVKNESQM